MGRIGANPRRREAWPLIDPVPPQKKPVPISVPERRPEKEPVEVPA